MRFKLFNARSICNKLSELQYMLYTEQMDVICITETWLNDNILTGLIDPECRYRVFRRDRSDRAGGGVCILVAKHLNVVQVPIGQHFPTLEALCVDIYCHSKCVRLFNIYRSPGNYSNDSTPAQYMAELVDCMQKFTPRNRPCYIVGDLNCPDINWANCTAPVDNVQDRFINFVTKNGFTQVVDNSTRASKILDIVLVNEPVTMAALDVCLPFVNSDHCQVAFAVALDCNDRYHGGEQHTDVRLRYQWKDADINTMSQFLGSINWLDVLSTNLTPNSLWEAFTGLLMDAINQFVPSRPILSQAQKGQYKKNYPRKIKEAMARKRCLWRLHKRDPNNNDARQLYKQAESWCRLLIQKYEIKKEANVISSSNLGAFYRHINKRLSRKDGKTALAR